MRDAALLDPQVRQAELPPVALGPHQVGAPLHHRDDVLVEDVRLDPLLLAPHARAVRPLGTLVALVEELDPGGGAARLQVLEVVHHLEQVVALGAAVDDLVQRVVPGAPGYASKNRPTRHGGAQSTRWRVELQVTSTVLSRRPPAQSPESTRASGGGGPLSCRSGVAVRRYDESSVTGATRPASRSFQTSGRSNVLRKPPRSLS